MGFPNKHCGYYGYRGTEPAMNMKKARTRLKPTLMRRPVIGAATLALATVTPATSLADPWEGGAYIEVGVIHSDNIYLSATDPEEDFLLMLAPGLRYTKDSERFNGTIDYRMEAFRYQDLADSSDISHLLNAELTTTLLRDKFYLDTNANAGQAIVSADAPIVLTNVPITGNRADYFDFTVQPRWEQRIGSVDLEARSAYTNYNFDTEDEIGEADYQIESNFELDNEHLQRGIVWDLRYEHTRATFEGALPYEYQRADFTLGLWVNSALQIFGLYGHETPIDEFLDPSMDSEVWEAGFLYVPSERMRIELAAGERGFGDSYRADINIAGQRSELSLTYDEGPATRASIVAGGSVVDYGPTEGLFDPLGTGDRFLQKLGAFVFTRQMPKSQFQIQLLSDRRENVLTATGTSRADEQYDSAIATYEWDVSARVAIELGAEYLKFEDEVRDGDLKRGRFSVTYGLGARTALTFAIDHIVNNDISFPYVATQVSLVLRRDFSL